MIYRITLKSGGAISVEQDGIDIPGEECVEVINSYPITASLLPDCANKNVGMFTIHFEDGSERTGWSHAIHHGPNRQWNDSDYPKCMRIHFYRRTYESKLPNNPRKC